ncbi:MAG: N-acetylneuraminate synthase family protein, partial [Candidatus Omnitrophota bacterium]
KKIKLPSSVITHRPLLKQCAKAGIFLFLSTGAASISEIADAISIITKHHRRIVLMQCTMHYPASLGECNLGVLDTLKYTFPFVGRGFSDHTASVYRAACAAAHMGAEVIEKHITLSKCMPGPDHFFALESGELKRMVRKIREAEKCKNVKRKIDKGLYGSTEKKVLASERYLKNFTYPILFARKNMKKGSIVRPSDLIILRRANFKGGISSHHASLFTAQNIRARCLIRKNMPLQWGSLPL